MSNKQVIAAALSLIAVFVVGFLIGFFVSPKDKDSSEAKTKSDVPTTDPFKQHEKLYESLQPSKLKEYLRTFSDRPHLAGSEIQLEYGRKMQKEWESYSEAFDKVEVFPYNILLSYFNQGETNVVKLLNETGDVVEEFTGVDKSKQGSGNYTLIPPILGYAKPGNATGTLLYANYGRQQDFQILKDKYNTTCHGHIVIMRYGKGYRGDKINQAAICGAEGAILFNDPEDYAPLGEDQTYPDTWWLPPSGAQRGNLRLVKGDPLTPELPAIDKIYRMTTDQVNMPQIPATPLPYGQAKELLRRMQGTEAPEDWQGGLKFTYRLGINTTGINVTVQVNAKLLRKNVTNIIGTIVGKEEPDRWVLIGSHRDAWGYGSVDSSSGTAVVMELARGLNTLVKSGWRPRRTIKLCSWAAEEQGLIGSTEWVEQQSKIVRERAVAYINIDAVVRGNYSIKAKGSPLLKQLMFEETRKVDDPRHAGQSLYERWKETTSAGSAFPAFGSLGSGSDFVPFYQFLGVPSLGFDYKFQDLNKTAYPVYHTKYETFDWMERFVDPDFHIHLSMCKLSARLLLRLADSAALPMGVTDYSAALINSVNNLKSSSFSGSPETITVDHIKKAILDFNKTANEFDNRIKKFTSTDFARLRVLNNQMANLEKIFINPYGLPGRPDLRNIVFAPSSTNLYGSASFPGITDQLGAQQVNWLEVKKQINILYKSVLEAREFLKPLEKDP